MCGISGFIDFNGKTSAETLTKMTDSMVHRGPDGRGQAHWQRNNVAIGFGHRRLSIIDLDERSAQPMQRGKLHLTFNGEIYNFQEIKDDLRSSKAGLLSEAGFQVPFITNGDTEVLLAAYAAWGLDCVKHFRGMFSFAIYDEAKGKIILVRDRLGVKPLFHYQKDGLHLFASELKAFHEHPDFDKSVDQAAVTGYFRYGFVPSPLCIFKHVSKLKPGSITEIDLNTGQVNSSIYWNPSQIIRDAQPTYLPEAERLKEVEALLVENFNYRMVADVPVGVFLSGGYDSSLVAALLQKDKAQKINTFTIGFERDGYNEATHAKRVADHLDTQHHEFTCTEKEARSIIPEIPFYYDEPFADSSAIPTFLVSKITAQHVKVALSADGGDELFAGYTRNLRFIDIYNKSSKIPVALRPLLKAAGQGMAKLRFSKSLYNSIWWDKMAIVANNPTLLNVFDTYPQYFSGYSLKQLLNTKVSIQNPQKELLSGLATVPDQLNALLSAEYQATLTNDMLVKVDRASMANGLEGREPMLDHKLYEYLANVSSPEKLGMGSSTTATLFSNHKSAVLKSILKKITHKHIPAKIMDRPKMGFAVPVHEWLTNELKPLVEHTLTHERINHYGFLNSKTVMNIKQKELEYKGRSAYLWSLLNFQMWCDRWL